MKLMLLTLPTRLRITALCTALAVTLLSGLIRPQIAVAQSAVGRRRPPRGGVLQGGGHPGGAALNNTPLQNRSPAVGGNAAVRPPAHAGTQSRSAIPPPSVPGSGINRSLPAPGLYGYVYHSNAPLYPLTGQEWGIYFPTQSVYYPHYYLNGTPNVTTYSPYYYYATFPPFIGTVSVFDRQPSIAYVPSRVYSSAGLYEGVSGGDAGTYNVNRPQNDGPHAKQITITNEAGDIVQDPLLPRTIVDIEAAWNTRNIRSLFQHVHQDSSVAIYFKDTYSYSLRGGDYLSMTRDALYAANTVSFTLDTVVRKSTDVYTASGRHTYTDKQGKDHTVLVSYVLEKFDGDYYLTQVGTAPERLDE